MKKLGFLAVVAMLAVSCNKPGGNKGVLELEREGYTLEDIHHGAEHHEDKGHAEAKEEVKEEVKTDTTAVKVEEVKTDSVK